MDRLRFGTDGWRDRMDGRFTTANVARAAAAYARHLVDAGARRVVVGHDTRRGSPAFAERAAAVLAAHGLEVVRSAAPLPTPVLSFAVRHVRADGGVMITASHNPAVWNGFKIKGPYGGTAARSTYDAVATRVADPVEGDVRGVDASAPDATLDVEEAYFEALARMLDPAVWRGAEARVVHDAMGGAASGWLARFAAWSDVGLRVDAFRGESDPDFHGVAPEPIAENMEATVDRMASSTSGFAAVTDGDGDRLGVVVAGGRILTAHEIFALLLDRAQRKGFAGSGAATAATSVVKTVTVSRIVERLARRRGLAVRETPVGFGYIVAEMLRGGVLIGGEESGGFGLPEHLPERDGLLNALLLVEAELATGVRLAERVGQLAEEAAWPHAYDRHDLPVPDRAVVDAVTARLASPPDRFAGRAVLRVERRDGVKLDFGDEGWLLFRASGTEPVFRLYAEARTPTDVAELLAAARTFVMATAGA